MCPTCSFDVLQILLDAKTRIPKLEEFDAPLQLFMEVLAEVGLHARGLQALKPEPSGLGNTSEGEFIVLGIAWQESTLDSMPL